MRHLPTLVSAIAIAAAIAAGACGDEPVAPEGPADDAVPPAVRSEKRGPVRSGLFFVEERWTDALEPSERIRVTREAESLRKR
jgi:hypothetical protein